MKYRLRQGTAKKLREQFYLSAFLGVIIWLLMAFLFYGDSNPITLFLYLGASVIFLPYIWLKKLKPYFNDLTTNVNSAYVEFAQEEMVVNHFDNLKKFNSQKIEFDIADVVHVKKAFRKDDSVNKVTVTLRNKSKIVIEDFEDMAVLLETLYTKSEALQRQSLDTESKTDDS